MMKSSNKNSTSERDLETVNEEDESGSVPSRNPSTKHAYHFVSPTDSRKFRDNNYSRELILSPYSLPLGSTEFMTCNFGICDSNTRNEDTLNAVSDNETSSSKSQITDESLFSSGDDVILEDESPQRFDNSLVEIADVHSDAVDVSSLRSSTRSSKYDVGCNIQEVSTPGCYGEVHVENSTEVHFGNKIYTAPITVVNNFGHPEDVECSNDQTSWKDPFAKPVWKQKRNREKRRETSRWTTKRLSMIISIVIFLSVSSALATVLIVIDTSSPDKPVPSTDDLLINESWFYTRDKWHASAPKQTTPLTLPVGYVLIEHTADANTCVTHTECEDKLVAIQNSHMYIDHTWDDIGYNYMVGGGPEGAIYVGRGANVIGSHAYGYNSRSLGVSFIGNYDLIRPSEQQMTHVTVLIEEAVGQGKVSRDYQIFGHCQVAGTISPGKFLMEEVMKMDHWNSTNKCIL